MTNHDPNNIPISTPGKRAAEANQRLLRVVMERGTQEQRERVRQTFTSNAPPSANNPYWSVFMGEAVATLAEMVDGLLREHEPKRRGRPPKKKPEEEARR